MSSFPYSILRAKKVKNIRIIESTEEIIDSKNITLDFMNQIDSIIQNDLFINNDDVEFVTSHINFFYRNNLATIFLVLHIRRLGNVFLTSQEYQGYVNYISRKKIKDESDIATKIKDENDMILFRNKLNFQMGCYNDKIQQIIEGNFV